MGLGETVMMLFCVGLAPLELAEYQSLTVDFII